MNRYIERRDYIETMKDSEEAQQRIDQMQVATRKEAVGQRLRAFLLRKGPTLSHAGEASHQESTTVRRWEKGPMRVSAEDLSWVAEVYGASGGALWG